MVSLRNPSDGFDLGQFLRENPDAVITGFIALVYLATLFYGLGLLVAIANRGAVG